MGIFSTHSFSYHINIAWLHRLGLSTRNPKQKNVLEIFASIAQLVEQRADNA